MELSLEPVHVPLTNPFTASHGEMTARELLLVTLPAADGATGYGEAAPLPSYDGVTLDTGGRGARGLPAAARHADREPPPQILARCAEVVLLAPALAALDLALWDMAGRRLGAPAWSLLGTPPGPPEPVAVNFTLTAADRSGAVAQAAEARAAGFHTLKAKVAIGDDHGRLAAIRAFAGPDMRIRIDANGAWTPAEAHVALRTLEPVGIELCEEPVSGVAAIRALDGVTEVPLALDESAADPRAMDAPACALMCLKISRCGGLQGPLEAARRARAVGYEVFLASTLDGPLGIAAALHAAALLRPSRANGLATLSHFTRPDPLPPVSGRIALPRGRARCRTVGLVPRPGLRSARRRQSRRAPRPPLRGPRRWTAWPAPGTTTSRASGSAAAICSATARNFASRSPTTSATGSASSPSRGHSEGSAPVPRPRRAAASPPVV